MDADPPDEVPYAEELRACVAVLKAARKAAGMTQGAVFARTGIHVNNLSQLERGALRNPTWKTLALYARAVGCRLTLGVELIDAGVQSERSAGSSSQPDTPPTTAEEVAIKGQNTPAADGSNANQAETPKPTAKP